LSHVRIVTTGGTIASRHDVDYGGQRAMVHGEDLVASLSGLGGDVGLSTTAFSLVDSRDMQPAMMVRLGMLVAEEARADDGISGFVVTHGTDTLEETAFVLAATLQLDKPVVLTGAMRPSDRPGSDGPRNLIDAVQVAADPGARGHGVVVVLDGQVHAARHVTKRHATADHAFASPETGPVGSVDASGPRLFWTAQLLPRLAPCAPDPDVELVSVVSGMTDRLLRAARDAGASGVVIEALGAGNVPDAIVPAIVDLIGDGIPVVLASRCGAGRVSTEYGGPGGGGGLIAAGSIPSNGLTGRQSRLAVALLLGAGMDAVGVRGWFDELSGRERSP
jgi:L-asparaginase